MGTGLSLGIVINSLKNILPNLTDSYSKNPTDKWRCFFLNIDQFLSF